MIKTQEDFLEKYLPLYCKGSKRVTQGLRVGGSWRPNVNCNILTPNLWPSTLCLSRSQMLNRRSRGHSAGWWLSLRHLISIFSGPQLIRAQRPLRPDVAFPTTSRLQLAATQLRWLLSWLSYIILQRPLDRPRDLWKRIFNRHQAEITVMQFIGHSLPARQSMRVSWDFFYLVPFHQPISAHAISSHNYL